MSVDNPEITTVTSKGQITIPSHVRDEFDLEEGTKLMVVPTEYGVMLKKIDLPSVTEFQDRVAERAGDTELSLDDVTELVHEARSTDQ
ncbi:MAG: AbrB/MazE/SpoVT family DNA-binding domain-containing protein [Halorhabdus sp.]